MCWQQVPLSFLASLHNLALGYSSRRAQPSYSLPATCVPTLGRRSRNAHTSSPSFRNFLPSKRIAPSGRGSLVRLTSSSRGSPLVQRSSTARLSQWYEAVFSFHALSLTGIAEVTLLVWQPYPRLRTRDRQSPRPRPLWQSTPTSAPFTTCPSVLNPLLR
jgi:hypothetical protein